MEEIRADVAVIGSGPGGYTAAFYAADKGKRVVLIDQDERLGGVCLNRGCIPSKSLLHTVKIIHEAKEASVCGVNFQEPAIDIGKVRSWKESVVEKLSKGITSLAGRRKVEIIRGKASFKSSDVILAATTEGEKTVRFDKAIIASGSRAVLPEIFNIESPLVMTSRDALNVESVPGKLLIVGGGYIGMELGTVYAGLGSQVTVIEALDSILNGADPDLVRPVKKYAQEKFKEVRVNAKVLKIEKAGEQIKAMVEAEGKQTEELYDKVLISIGRRPNSEDLNLKNTKVKIDEKGHVKINEKKGTDDPNIYAIGDVAGGIQLAHKASHEARIAVRAICGELKSVKEPVIPAVVFTDPEVAWCGLTETEARQTGKEVKVSRFPWSASGRAVTLNRTDGVTKLVIDPQSEKILGVGLAGSGAGELISEGVLAVEKGLTVKELGDLVHPHPTLSETLMECAEMFYGTATHAAPTGRR